MFSRSHEIPIQFIKSESVRKMCLFFLSLFLRRLRISLLIEFNLLVAKTKTTTDYILFFCSSFIGIMKMELISNSNYDWNKKKKLNKRFKHFNPIWFVPLLCNVSKFRGKKTLYIMAHYIFSTTAAAAAVYLFATQLCNSSLTFKIHLKMTRWKVFLGRMRLIYETKQKLLWNTNKYTI